MKNYRIITDGTSYRVQEKGWFGQWHTMGWGGGYGGWYPHQFSSPQEAKDWLLEKHAKLVTTDDCEWKVTK